MGRPRKFKTAKALGTAWETYKEYCDNQIVLTHEFSSKNSEFVSKELKRSITYTIEGFCVFSGTKQDTNISGSLDIEKSKLDDLIEQMRGDG